MMPQLLLAIAVGWTMPLGGGSRGLNTLQGTWSIVSLEAHGENATGSFLKLLQDLKLLVKEGEFTMSCA
jgi:hypothetical protein